MTVSHVIRSKNTGMVKHQKKWIQFQSMLLTIVSLEERESSSFQIERHGKYLSVLTLWRYTMTIETQLTMENIQLELPYIFRDLVYCHHNRKHGGMSDPQAAGRVRHQHRLELLKPQRPPLYHQWKLSYNKATLSNTSPRIQI